MAESDLVSVVVPTYYRNDMLRDAVASVRAQTYDPVEVIVVDGSGEAHARPVARDTGVRYVAQDVDRGPHAARDRGAELARGDYVAFLDDDDRYRPEKLERQVPLLGDGVGVVYCGIDDDEFGVAPPDPEVRGNVLERALAMNTLPCIPSTMVLDRETLAAIRPLRHRHGADDTGMKIELALRTAFDYADAPLVERRQPPGTLSESWAHVEGRWLLLEEYADLYERFPDEIRRTAVRQTHYRAGRKRVEEKGWSAAGLLDLARAAYHTPEDRRRYVRDCLAGAFGRPGLRVADALG